MKIYEVGGCVRDLLLGLKPKDVDYVVVGSTPEKMLALNFEQVGAAFPVFLHPETKDEYALARREIKNGSGYLGFTTETEGVTLEQDLYRRDLTINAIAMDGDKNIIDPYNGQEDLKNGILRHVSSHFNEDPVRLLRIARFAARYDFAIADETNEMLKGMVENGEINTLQGERVWLELEKTLNEKHVNRFFEALTNCNACEKIFPFATFPDMSKFSPENTARDNLLIIFSQLNKKELASWKVPAHEKEMIVTYKHFIEAGKAYSEMEPQERLVFIKTVKALHKDAQDPEIVNNIFTHLQRFKLPSLNIASEKALLEQDVEKLRNHPFEAILEEHKKQFPKANIGEFMKQEFIKAISNNKLTTYNKARP